jgi:hypothetical protein
MLRPGATTGPAVRKSYRVAWVLGVGQALDYAEHTFPPDRVRSNICILFEQVSRATR